MKRRSFYLKPSLVLLIILAVAACNTASIRPLAAALAVHSGAVPVSPAKTSQAAPTSVPTFTPTQTQPPTLTPTPEPTFTPTPEPTLTPTPEPSPTPLPSPTPTETLAAEHIIAGIRGHRQLLELDCETSAALDWARFLGKDFDELTFQSQLPVSDNPDYGFVGDVNAAWGQIPPYGYGVYAGPVADLLNVYGIQAQAYKGYTLDQIKTKIDQDIPVITWVIGLAEPGTPYPYTDSEGRTTVVAPYEHVVMVIGYTPTTVRVMSEGKWYNISTERFLSSWGVLGNMVVVDK